MSAYFARQLNQTIISTLLCSYAYEYHFIKHKKKILEFNNKNIHQTWKKDEVRFIAGLVICGSIYRKLNLSKGRIICNVPTLQWINLWWINPARNRPVMINAWWINPWWIVLNNDEKKQAALFKSFGDI
jgi:hypothetical protein